MNVDKKKITLVGLKQAKISFSFLYEGSLNECRGCELYKICMTNLDSGRIYKVISLRNKTYPCKVHEEGVRVVEVVEPDLDVNIEPRLAFPSGIITFQSQECEEVLCINHRTCVPLGLVSGDRCKILKVEGQVECPLNRSLILVGIQRLVE